MATIKCTIGREVDNDGSKDFKIFLFFFIEEEKNLEIKYSNNIAEAGSSSVISILSNADHR